MKVIEKIKKILSLAQSSNPYEAAAAMAKAQALMSQHQISDHDIMMADIVEAQAPTARNSLPPSWMNALIFLAARAFAVKPLLQQRGRLIVVSFIGIGPAPELASYAFSCLRRQATRDRAVFLKSCRGKRANRTRRADLFAEAWAMAVAKQVRAFAGQGDPQLIEQYMAERHAVVSFHQPKQPKLTVRDGGALLAGLAAGGQAKLRHGVAGQAPRQIGEV